MQKNKHLTRKFLSISITTALAVGTMQAHALIEAPLRQNATAQNIVRQADTTGAVLDVNKAQTARTPVDIGNARLNIEAQRMVAQTAVETAKEIKENIDAITPGIGVSRSSNCIVQKEHKKHVEKQDLSNQVRKAVASSQAAKFYKSSGDKRAARATDHYMNYCDVSEAKYGNCLPAVNGRGGANTDYGNIANNLTLTSEQISAGYSYMQNIVDPSKTDLSQCETIACRALEMKEAQYHAIGSMIQNAFLNQIQDSIAYDVPPGGVKTITVEQLGELSAPWDGRLAKWDEGAGTQRSTNTSLPSSSGYGSCKFEGKPSANFTAEVKEHTLKAAKELGMNPNELASIFSFETGGQLKASTYNPRGPAYGFIQFTPAGVQGLGVSVYQLGKMSVAEQMPYVVKYLERHPTIKRVRKAGRALTIADIYQAVQGCYSTGIEIGVSPCYTSNGRFAGKQEIKQYNANRKGWDVNNDGVVAYGEAVQGEKFAAHCRAYFPEYVNK